VAADAAATETATEILEDLPRRIIRRGFLKRHQRPAFERWLTGRFFLYARTLVEANRFSRAGN
jgi:hypothetical protein